MTPISFLAQEKLKGYVMTDDSINSEDTQDQDNKSDGIKNRLKEFLASQIEKNRITADEMIGGEDPVPDPDADISLNLSRKTVIAGELWSVSGEISNRSTKPIWITDTGSRLSLAPEMYGQSSKTGSLPAFFPTVPTGNRSDIVRIDPGASYILIWKIDPCTTSEQHGSDVSIFGRVSNSIRSFSFFNPGQYSINASIHLWSKKPVMNNDTYVTNLGESFCKSVTKEIDVESSPWVLIMGAAIGGILCFVLQLLFRNIVTGETAWSAAKAIFVGSTSAVILTGVVTVLLSRLATTDFILVVKIKDIWGAIATGFAIQWIGYPVLEKILNAVSTT